MKAYLNSVRIAPKKANLIAQIIRGLTVPEAVEQLRNTHKKGARMIEQLLLSAMANASHNDRQDPQTMVIKSIVVNQGTAYRRGMPMARGRTRPYRKFLSHINLELGFPGDVDKPKKAKNEPKVDAKAAAKTEKAAAAKATKAPAKKTTKKTSTSSAS